MNLDGRAVLVTGASRGLGRALAEAAVAKGARVVAVARDEKGLAGLEGVFALPGDVSKKNEIHRIAGAATALVGRIDVLVNNASALGPTPLRQLVDTECEDFEAVLQANLLGPFRLAKLLAGPMVLARSGLVLNVSSDAATNAYSGWGIYGVSKAALDHLTRSFAAELGESGVRFLSVDPGEMDTRMHADAVPDADPKTLARPVDVARKLVEIIEASDRLTNGTRLEASGWKGAPSL
jgi:NAD(P)-dependent dehydrogenase (short-subunit alcohol dehydrogenase family)